ncbi:MAG: M23 family metallopeptidase [Campylobacterota bacterium]|nr:M23 family metallopeptidase [Campylobacterota bacterium]
MKILSLLILSFTSLFSKIDIELSHTNIKHGTTFAVILQSDTKLTHAPNVIFKNKTYQMFTIGGNTKKYELFLPVDYHSKKQKENLQVKYIEDGKVIKKNISIDIIDGDYQQNEIITVAKGKVTLSKSNKNRSKEEYSKVYKNVYSVITTTNQITKSTFDMPIDSKITSAYGNARVYNGTTKSYHTGTDFRAKVGTDIFATNDGVVALVMDRFYLGKVIYLNHGRGMYSYYSHMSSFDVKKGQIVKKGDILGKSGKTGRVMGPHLHYAVRLYNTTVDPLQFSSLHNEIVKMYHN